MTFSGRPTWSAKKCAKRFNAQYTPRPTSTNINPKRGRRINRKLLRLRREDAEVSPEQVANAIKATKSSKALGPDDIAPVHLKHLGVNGILFLTATINLSLTTINIPSKWKVGRVIPLLKPGKPVDQSTSFRPIALLFPVAKLVERLLLPELQDHLPLQDHQHGFRKGRSTTTALNIITHNIACGFNKPKPCDRTILVALDLSRAFDTISITVLLEDIYASSLKDSTKRWLATYIRGRSTFVEFRDARSRLRKVCQGVPQGGVLSPALFNYYMSSMPLPPNNITVVSYADDITILSSGTKPADLCMPINAYLDELNDWMKKRQLILSAEKSTTTLFTTWNKENGSDLNIMVAGKKLTYCRTPKVLGVTFDPSLTFSQHSKNICTKIGQRNNILKALAGSTWGCTKEVLLSTYKAVCRSVLNYAAPIWTPGLSDTRWKDLQTKQNAALRTVTGCHVMASSDHLHHETRVMKVREHNELLSTQFFLGAHLEERPDHRTTEEPPARHRKIQPTLRSKFGPWLADNFGNLDSLDTAGYRSGLSYIHQVLAGEAASNYTPPVWPEDGVGEPNINPQEKTLPRSTRCTLSQLRSGYSKLLGSYMSRIDPNTENKCPKCGTEPHDVPHLFDCPSDPTDWTADALWSFPVEISVFLGLEQGVGPPGRPPQRRINRVHLTTAHQQQLHHVHVGDDRRVPEDLAVLPVDGLLPLLLPHQGRVQELGGGLRVPRLAQGRKLAAFFVHSLPSKKLFYGL